MKPTGNPPGRPRKTKEAKAKRGRQRIPLAARPDRYEILFYQVGVDRGCHAGLSERRFAEQFVSLKLGIPDPTPENLAAMKARRRYKVFTDKAQGKGNSLRAAADCMRQNIRRFRKNPTTFEDARWLAAMAFALHICFDAAALEDFAERFTEFLVSQVEGFAELPPQPAHERLESFAEFLAEQAGELDYFNARMRPILQAAR